MRNWHPFVQETMEQVRAAGVERLACVCLAPQFSEMSVGLYMKHASAAAGGVELAWAASYADEPLLIDAFAERLQGLRGKVLFTAHSLPAPNERYDREARVTASAVAARLGLTDWEFAYQSQGMSGGNWLGPTVESCLDRYAAQGVREVVIAPIGFVCDHVEILYDIDVLFRAVCGGPGYRLDAAREFERLGDVYGGIGGSGEAMRVGLGRCPWTRCTPQELRSDRLVPRVVIIGGGISGLATAYYLAKGGVIVHHHRIAPAPGRGDPDGKDRRVHDRGRAGQLPFREARGDGPDRGTGLARRGHRV